MKLKRRKNSNNYHKNHHNKNKINKSPLLSQLLIQSTTSQKKQKTTPSKLLIKMFLHFHQPIPATLNNNTTKFQSLQIVTHPKANSINFSVKLISSLTKKTRLSISMLNLINQKKSRTHQQQQLNFLVKLEDYRREISLRRQM